LDVLLISPALRGLFQGPADDGFVGRAVYALYRRVRRLHPSTWLGFPHDGSPVFGLGPQRVLRGGCFHNWAIHCTVSKRYQIEKQFHDGCIGFRAVMAET
jgi:hypothetical protein